MEKNNPEYSVNAEKQKQFLQEACKRINKRVNDVLEQDGFIFETEIHEIALEELGIKRED